jgi:release factor glutamine methyltransferase
VTVGEALALLEPREARLLLARATGFSEASVLAHPERELPREAEARFRGYAARRARGEPIAYILGEKEFYGLALAVSPAVLIPRPETELLVELALACAPASVLDLGTGSGAIALVLKRQLPQARVVAVEASAAALAVARRNAAALALEVDFRHGRWYDAVPGERFDVIACNPPYVAEGDPHLAQGDLRFEPRSALAAGPDGLDAIREIARSAAAHLTPGGRLLLEHGLGQDAAVRKLLEAAGLEGVMTWPDLAGIARVTGGRLKS